MPVRSGALIIWSAPTPSTQWLIGHRYAELLELATQQNLLPVAATASGETIPVFDMMVIGVGDDGHVGTCVEIKLLRHVCSMAWRCRFLTARPSQRGRVIAEK